MDLPIWHEIGSQVFDVNGRSSLLLTLLAPLALAAGCVDAPITSAQLQADGSLAAGSAQQLFETSEAEPAPQVAQTLQLTAVLAAESEGALEDRKEYLLGEHTRIHLHLRADGLEEARPVKFVWTHQTGADGLPAVDEEGKLLEPIETMGFLTSSETLEMAASREVTEADVGTWQVEVRGVGPFGALLTKHSFRIHDPEAPEAPETPEAETPAS